MRDPEEPTQNITQNTEEDLLDAFVQDLPLTVFALETPALPLRTLRDTLLAADYPVSISTGIAGEATEKELDALDWQAAFVRWDTPELHDVYLLERDLVGNDEEADLTVAKALRLTLNRPESADKLILIDHLRRTRVVYGIQILPALLADSDHPAWSALDVVLRCLAENTEGLIYAEDEGFYDADGEPMLVQPDDD